MQRVTAKAVYEALNATVKAKRKTAYVSFGICLRDGYCVGAGKDFAVRIGRLDIPVEKVGGKYWSFTVFFDETFSFRPYGSIRIPPWSAIQLTEAQLTGLCHNLLEQMENGLKHFPV
jgi:hypothetical protein